MRITRFLHDLSRSRRPHYILDLFLAEFDQLFVVFVQIERDLGDGDTELVFLGGEFHAIVVPRQYLA